MPTAEAQCIYLLFMTPTRQAENETFVAPFHWPRQDGWRVQAGKAAKSQFRGSCHLRSLEGSLVGLLTDQGMGHVWSVSSELDSAPSIFFQPFGHQWNPPPAGFEPQDAPSKFFPLLENQEAEVWRVSHGRSLDPQTPCVKGWSAAAPGE